MVLHKQPVDLLVRQTEFTCQFLEMLVIHRGDDSDQSAFMSSALTISVWLGRRGFYTKNDFKDNVKMKDLTV